MAGNLPRFFLLPVGLAGTRVSTGTTQSWEHPHESIKQQLARDASDGESTAVRRSFARTATGDRWPF